MDLKNLYLKKGSNHGEEGKIGNLKCCNVVDKNMCLMYRKHFKTIREYSRSVLGGL